MPRAAAEDMPQLRCVGGGCRVLTGRVSLLARCELTAVRLAGPSKQVGCCGSRREPKGTGTRGRVLTHISSQAGSINVALPSCAVLPVVSLIDRLVGL